MRTFNVVETAKQRFDHPINRMNVLFLGQAWPQEQKTSGSALLIAHACNTFSVVEWSNGRSNRDDSTSPESRF